MEIAQALERLFTPLMLEVGDWLDRYREMILATESVFRMLGDEENPFLTRKLLPEYEALMRKR